MVQAYKFSCVRPLHRLIAEQLASAQPNEWARLPLVPIPTTHRSFVRRGFRTVPLLCRSLSRITGQPVLRLLRARNALPQKSLTYEERCLNAQAALRRRRRIGKVPREAVLVDDVFTTGATSSAAARILRESGVERVVVLTVAMEY
jgi:ComF family protein